MIGRIKRWWRRWFGPEDYQLFDTTDIHEYLVDRMKEWEEDFHPDKW